MLENLILVKRFDRVMQFFGKVLLFQYYASAANVFNCQQNYYVRVDVAFSHLTEQVQNHRWLLSFSYFVSLRIVVHYTCILNKNQSFLELILLQRILKDVFIL